MSRTRRRSKLAKGRRSRKNGRSRKQTRRGSRRALMWGGGEDEPTAQTSTGIGTNPNPKPYTIGNFMDDHNIPRGNDVARPPPPKKNWYNSEDVRPAPSRPESKPNKDTYPKMAVQTMKNGQPVVPMKPDEPMPNN